MSSEANIGVTILDLVEFFSALTDLKRACRKADQLKTKDGQTHRVEAVFKDSVGREVGVQKSEKGYRFVTDCEGLSAQEKKQQVVSVQQVVQRYAQRKILKELQAQGYVVAEEEKRSDNTIRMVVRKWDS